MRPIVGCVIFLYVAFIGTAAGIYLAGKAYMPELMASQAVSAPLVLSLLGFGTWLVVWSVKALKRPDSQDNKT